MIYMNLIVVFYDLLISFLELEIIIRSYISIEFKNVSTFLKTFTAGGKDDIW